MVGWGSFQFDKNAIVIVLDSVRHDLFMKANTPNIDALQGIRFDNCYAQASQTLAAYYLMMIGHFPYQNGTEQIFGRMIWLPLKFKEHKYRTVAVMSMPYLSAVWGCDKGWDVFIQMPSHNMVKDLIFQSVAMIKNTRKFFLYLNIGDTHRPFDFGKGNKTIWRDQDIWNFNYREGNLTSDYLQYLKTRQIAAIEYVDSQLLTLFDSVDLSKTTIMVTSDHGELFGEDHKQGHGIGHHRQLYHVPMIIKE